MAIAQEASILVRYLPGRVTAAYLNYGLVRKRRNSSVLALAM